MSTWTPRYSVFSVTGFTIDRPIQRSLLPFRRRLHTPITTWYVTDNCDCARVIRAFGSEHEAHLFRKRLSAEDREWEKRQERERLAATNGQAT